MIVLTVPSVTFYSENDERSFFEWLGRMPCVQETRGMGTDILITLQSRVIPDQCLKELIAIFCRYELKAKELANFLTTENSPWFKHPTAYWHEAVFGNND